ncbi:MAG: SCP2 sterol-binding domain-containing protein [Anaerolineae bacterium]
MPVPDTAKEIIEAMPSAFLPERAEGLKATCQFELTGEEGGNWVLEIANQQCQVKEGVVAAPDATISLAAADYVAMVKGELDVMRSFMKGRLKVKGNMGLVMKVLDLFQRPEEG